LPVSFPVQIIYRIVSYKATSVQSIVGILNKGINNQ